MFTVMAGSLLASLALTPTAEACGGFFCNRTDPVDQSGEDILFAVDEESNTTTAHIQIAYQGAADEFAWIVPVTQQPEILLSTDRLFQEIDWRTRPNFGLEIVERWDCAGGSRGYDDMMSPAAASDYNATSTASGTVVVVDEKTVGPYETVILQAQSSEGLLDWLQTNGYALPDTLDPVLQPYIAADSYFVALRLSKDTDLGALQPIALRYPGQGVSIPIQLTSVAATPDMRLKVYVVGGSRSVPESYLHVKLNDLVVDWFSAGSNYEQAITVAADEAGGHAFATDYSGPSSVMDEVLFRAGQYDIPALAASADAYQFFDRMLQQGFVGDQQMLELFREFLPIPPGSGVDEQSFYNCLSCYSDIVDQIPFDAEAFAAAIDERVVGPMRDAQRIFDRNPHLTRMTSSVSPVEMTLDPTFVFNPDMDQVVSQQRSATLEMLCGFGGAWDTSPRRLKLADGRAYELPSIDWFRQEGITEYEYLSELMTNYAIVIEETSAEGDPSVLADFTQEAFEQAAVFNDRGLDGMASGCGCRSVGGVAPALILPLLGLVIRRRRSA
jgi:hypothetical protein